MFHLAVVTPERTIYENEIKMLIAPAYDGEIGILQNHRPIIVKLKLGRVRIIQENDTEEVLLINGGHLEFNNNKATILADVGENINEIALEQAIAAREKGEEVLKKVIDQVEAEKLKNELQMHLLREKLVKDLHYYKRRGAASQ